MRSSARLAFELVLSALAFSTSSAPAEAAHFSVPARVDPCVPIDARDFQRLLAVELGASDGESGRVDHMASIDLSCDGDLVRLTLDDAVTRKSMTRRVDLWRVDPSARTRLMALTVAEFVMASWLEVQLAAPKAIAPVGPAPAPALIEQAEQVVEPRLERLPAPQLGAAVETLAFTSSFRLMPSFALRLSLPVSAAWGLRIGTQLGRGNLDGMLVDEREGQPVTIRLTTASLLLALMYTVDLDALELTAGAGGRVGFARMEGVQPSSVPVIADSAYAPWAGPLVLLGLAHGVSPRVKVSLTLELGYVTLRARALGPKRAVVTELGELWTGASLGVDLSL